MFIIYNVVLIMENIASMIRILAYDLKGHLP